MLSVCVYIYKYINKYIKKKKKEGKSNYIYKKKIIIIKIVEGREKISKSTAKYYCVFFRQTKPTQKKRQNNLAQIPPKVSPSAIQTPQLPHKNGTHRHEFPTASASFPLLLSSFSSSFLRHLHPPPPPPPSLPLLQ